MILTTDTTVLDLPQTFYQIELKALYNNYVLLQGGPPDIGGLTTPHTYLLYCMETQTLSGRFPVMTIIIEVCREGIFMETPELARAIVVMD